MADLTCPYCGKSEPNEFLLDNNHWVGSPFVHREAVCISMDLTRRHVTHYVKIIGQRRLLVASVAPKERPQMEKELRQAEEGLERTLTRARVVWPADRQDWIDEKLAELEESTEELTLF